MNPCPPHRPSSEAYLCPKTTPGPKGDKGPPGPPTPVLILDAPPQNPSEEGLIPSGDAFPPFPDFIPSVGLDENGNPVWSTSGTWPPPSEGTNIQVFYAETAWNATYTSSESEHGVALALWQAPPGPVSTPPWESGEFASVSGGTGSISFELSTPSGGTPGLLGQEAIYDGRFWKLASTDPINWIEFSTKDDPSSSGIHNSIHVAIRNDGSMGDGSINNPYDWSDPEVAEAMLLKWAEEKSPMTINISDGIFYIPASIFENESVWSVWDNLTIRGQGMRRTILRPKSLGDPSPAVTYRSQLIGNFFNGQVSNPPENVVTNFSLESVTLDCMQETSEIHMWAALRVNGSNIILRDVEVTRCGGQGINGNSELFPITLAHVRSTNTWTTQKTLYPGIYVDNVYINKSKFSDAGGATALIVTSWYANDQLSDNWVHYTAMIRNVRSSESGILGVAKINNVLWENCYNDTAGVNIDTGPCRNIVFRNCTFLNAPGNPSAAVRIGSNIPGVYHQVSFYNCVFHAARNGVGFGGVGIRNGVDLTVRDCYFIPTKTETGGDVPDPNWNPVIILTGNGRDNRLAISGNRLYNGAALPEVRFFHFGNRTGSYTIKGKVADQLRESNLIDALPLVDWHAADFDAGDIASRGRDAIQLSTHNVSASSENDDGYFLEFDGIDQYATAAADPWERVLDGRGWTIVVDGPNIGGYPDGTAVRILSCHRSDGWGVGWHLARASDRRLAFGTNTENSLTNLESTHCYTIEDEPLVRAIISGNAERIHIVAIHASGDIRHFERTSRITAAATIANNLHIARPATGTITYGNPEISRIRFYDQFLDLNKL